MNREFARLLEELIVKQQKKNNDQLSIAVNKELKELSGVLDQVIPATIAAWRSGTRLPSDWRHVAAVAKALDASEKEVEALLKAAEKGTLTQLANHPKTSDADRGLLAPWLSLKQVDFAELLKKYVGKLPKMGTYKVSKVTGELFGEKYQVSRSNIDIWSTTDTVPSDWRPILAMAAAFKVRADEAEEMLQAANIPQTLQELAQDPRTTFADHRLLNWWLNPPKIIGVTKPTRLQASPDKIKPPGDSGNHGDECYLTVILEKLRLAYLGSTWQNNDLTTVEKRIHWHPAAHRPNIVEGIHYGLVSVGNTVDLGHEWLLMSLEPEDLVESLAVALNLGAQGERPVFTFQLGFPVSKSEKYCKEIITILYTPDPIHPLPTPNELKPGKFKWKSHQLYVDDWPIDNVSYAVFRLLRTETRGRKRASSASPWNRLFVQAEHIAQMWHAGERELWESPQDVWEECNDLLTEAGKLLRADPFYLPEEAENIYYDVLKTCKAKIIPAESSKGGMRDYHGLLEDDPAFGQLLKAHELDPTLDWTERMSRYEGALQRTRSLLGRFDDPDPGATRGS